MGLEQGENREEGKKFKRKKKDMQHWAQLEKFKDKKNK